ncbi:MAG: hypothetical protein AAF629_23955 [Chloroflexota bacterium]
MRQTQAHGTIITLDQNLPTSAWDCFGNMVFEAKWESQALQEIRLRIPDGRFIKVLPAQADHPIFGVSDQDLLEDELSLTLFQHIDWAKPGHIPPLDNPTALPSGAGTAILNFIAFQAQHNDQSSLRYRGPYPTGSLFDALLESFVTVEPTPTAFETFTVAVEQRASQASMDVVPVDFRPAPFERIWLNANICVQLRDGLEKAFIQGRTYSRDADSPRRLRRCEGGYIAQIELAGSPWAKIAVFNEAGLVTGGPYSIPDVTSDYIGLPLPDSIRGLLVEALPPRAPNLMQTTLHAILENTPIVWADTADEVAIVRDNQICLHAVLLEKLAQHPPEHILNFVAQAVEPVAQRLAQQRLATEQPNN